MNKSLKQSPVARARDAALMRRRVRTAHGSTPETPANGNFAPKGSESAITSDLGLYLLFKITKR